jgi:hypothetical protein
MAKTKQVTGGAKPEPDAPIIILKSDCIRVLLGALRKAVVIDRATGKVQEFKMA